MNAALETQPAGVFWNWPFLAVLAMASSIAAFETGMLEFATAAAASFGALLWRLRPAPQQLFLILMPGLPIVALPLADKEAGNAAVIAMAALLVWTGIVCQVWRRTEDINNRLGLLASALVVVGGAALFYYMKPGSTFFAPNPVATLQSAADTGDTQAQYVLALRYRNGEGVDQDYAKALDLAKRAADQGYAPAQTLAGMMYQNGEGTSEDASTAASYYEKAAAQSDPWAQSLLGGMYLSGTGVEQNNVLAYKWLTKAAAQGNAAAKSLLDAAKDTFTDEERQEGETQAAQN